MREIKDQFKTAIQKQVSLKYLLYLADDSDIGDGPQWPLIVYLHGMNRRGDNLELLRDRGLPKVLGELEDFPFMVLAPQCPPDSSWIFEQDAVRALIQKIVGEYPVDRSRIYLTGQSMGGYGTWHLAAAHPEMFAAVAPICGGANAMLGFPDKVRALKDTPVWAFHGAEDNRVPLRESQVLVDELRKYSENVRFTIYPGSGHDISEQTYRNPELYEWLMGWKKE